jgi:hypothetical protein
MKNKHKLSSTYKYLYPHFCRIDHEEVGYCWDKEECPVCEERRLREKAEDELIAFKQKLEKWSNRIDSQGDL